MPSEPFRCPGFAGVGVHPYGTNSCPDFTALPLPVSIVGATSEPVFEGAQLFHSKGCEYCHAVSGYGGHRGPGLTDVGDRLSGDQTIIRIMNGGTNMPACGSPLSSQELNYLVTFLAARKSQRR